VPVTAAATFCAVLVDEWARAGVTAAFVAPGSRSTPLALALADDPRIEVHVHLDERGASFMALGHGLARRWPAVLVCTSGTAAAHFHAAVVEAHQSDVAMIVCTADRPPELRDSGAPQTIDQLRLYGPAVRWFHEPGVPDPAAATTWRALAARAVAEATGVRPGPVHLNLAFREPLVGEAGPLPPAREGDVPWTGAGVFPPGPLTGALPTLLEERRGIIVAGRGAPDPVSLHRLAVHLGWPVLADPTSGCRVPRPTTVAAFDGLLREEAFAADHRPKLVVRFGAPPASKVLAQWLAGSGATEVVVGASPAWSDPDGAAALRVVADPAAVCDHLVGRMAGAGETPWLARWRRAEAAAQEVLSARLGADRALSEPAVARAVVAGLPAGAQLHVSSSMPVRDVEWFAAPREALTVTANRGANGIDGVISTAIGVALARASAPTAVLAGDLAFLHDSTALIGLARRDLDLVVIVVDNDGGGIFSFLPQATQLETDRFEQLFGTPHGADLVALAGAHGLETSEPRNPAELTAALRSGQGPRIVRVATDRAANVAVHDALNAAVADAVRAVR